MSVRTGLLNTKLPRSSSAKTTTALNSACTPVRGWRRAMAALATAIVGVALAGCSRTVTWEEEVPLNTGETIVIQRSMPWELRGGFGNPFDIAMRPTGEQTIRFEYKQKKYVYSGRANVLWLVISPSMRPVLVARAGDLAWAKLHNYYCVVPYYVQFNSDAMGAQWTWPTTIDSWLYGKPANIMASTPIPGEPKRLYRNRDKYERDVTFRLQFPTATRIDPQYTEEGCIHARSKTDGRTMVVAACLAGNHLHI